MHNRELERLLAVDRFLKLKISRENELEEIAEAAARICNMPVALISLLDADTRHFRVRFGTTEIGAEREDVFCNHVITQNEVVIVPDVSKDERFIKQAPDGDSLSVAFYAGAPLITQDGLVLGSLCVIGHEPAGLSTQQVLMLATLCRQIIHILEFDYSLRIMKEQYLEAKKNEITLKSLFESTRSCILLIDLDLKVVFFNQMLSDYMEEVYSVKPQIGTTITDLIRDDFLYEFLVNFNKARTGQQVLKEAVLLSASGETCWQYSFDPAYDTEGNITGVSYSSVDISELKESQKKNMEKEQSLHAIALIQSHEIRRPVSSILGLIHVFKLNEYQAGKEELMMLETAAKELDGKIKDIVVHAGL